jgi:uncharacterized membrane protein YhaH (DUF805 family)
MGAFLWDWYAQPWRKYAQFDGRACRFEYWTFFLANFVISLLLIAIPHALFIRLIFSFASFIPGIAVSVRRLHDRGHGGWYMLLVLVPFVGGLVLLVFMLLGSQKEENRWGPDPTLAHEPQVPAVSPSLRS